MLLLDNHVLGVHPFNVLALIRKDIFAQCVVSKQILQLLVIGVFLMSLLAAQWTMWCLNALGITCCVSFICIVLMPFTNIIVLFRSVIIGQMLTQTISVQLHGYLSTKERISK